MWDYKEVLKESEEYWKENQRGNHRKTIGKPHKIRGGPLESIGKPKGNLMESIWDYKEIVKESEEN